MNKTRLLGILIVGIILMYTIDNDLSSFISGISIGIGGALTIAGKTFFSRKKAE
jgi:drug/metabolite transporter (DMT)-like permease